MADAGSSQFWNSTGVFNLRFPCHLAENLDTLYLKFLCIPSLPNRTITEKIYLCTYDVNDVSDQDKWEVDSGGGVGKILGVIADEKEFDNDRDNTVSMVEEVHAEVEDQDGRFVLVSNNKIDTMKKDQLCADILKIRIK